MAKAHRRRSISKAPVLSLGMLALAVLPLAVLLTRNTPGAGAPGSSAGLPCIPLHEARMLAPGCTRTMHLYDSSCLAAFKAAMAADGAFALVALDTFSAATRSAARPSPSPSPSSS